MPDISILIIAEAQKSLLQIFYIYLFILEHFWKFVKSVDGIFHGILKEIMKYWEKENIGIFGAIKIVYQKNE